MADETPLLVTRDGPVLRATFNRPARRNALSQALFAELDALLARLKDDRETRVVVLSGAGGHFCAGLDLAEVGGVGADLEEQQARNRAIGARFQAISDLPQVVIAAVQGSAFAGGLGFVCAADIAFASAEARFAAPEVRRGLVPAQILPWLVRRMGRSQAAPMCLRGAVLDAPAALSAGLVHALAPDAAALEAMVAAAVADILEGAPVALAETKGLIAALGATVPPGYAEAGAAAFGRTAAGAEAAEGIASFREKRKPGWAAR
jgi:isohexenylglutaconyl-CoA hydratase